MKLSSQSSTDRLPAQAPRLRRGDDAHRTPPTDLVAQVFPAGTAAELLSRLADALAQPVAIACAVTGTHRVAHPSVGLVDADPPASLELTDPVAERLRQQAAAMDAAALDEKLEAMAELAAGAGHEVNNPLATIAGRAKLLLKNEADPKRARALAQIAAEAYRGRDMIGDLMLFGRPPQPVLEAVAVGPVLADVLAEFADDLAAKSLRITGSRDDATVQADAAQLAIVLSELLRNAIRFAAESSSVDIAIVAGDPVRITVADDGPGLTPEQRRHLFDPFYSGRQAGRGLGFGLSKCWRIVHQHGGRIAAAQSPMRLVIDWPAAS